MSTGTVITARGEALNLDMLIEQAKRPIRPADPTAVVEKPHKPTSGRSLNVRAYVPPRGRALAPSVPEEPVVEKVPATPSRFREDGEAQSLADLTGIRVDTPTRLRLAKEGEQGIDRKELAEKHLLGRILSELQTQSPSAVQEADRIEREEAKAAKAKKAMKRRESEDDSEV